MDTISIIILVVLVFVACAIIFFSAEKVSQKAVNLLFIALFALILFKDKLV